MRCNTKCLLVTLFLLLTRKGIPAQRGKFTNEMKLMHCLCTSPTPERLQKIQCMESFVSPYNPFRFYQGVQYCGYFAYRTNFGETIRQRTGMVNYNPWSYAPDLNTEKSCSYTRYKPGQSTPAHIRMATPRGWVLSKCFIDMAKMRIVTAQHMLRTCCWNS